MIVIKLIWVPLSSVPGAGARAALPGALRLDGRAGHRAVGAEDAAVVRLGAQHRAAAAALVKDPAGVLRHDFRFCGRAMRTGDAGFQDHGVVF